MGNLLFLRSAYIFVSSSLRDYLLYKGGYLPNHFSDNVSILFIEVFFCDGGGPVPCYSLYFSAGFRVPPFSANFLAPSIRSSYLQNRVSPYFMRVCAFPNTYRVFDEAPGVRKNVRASSRGSRRVCPSPHAVLYPNPIREP
jgi:hypothetical protein